MTTVSYSVPSIHCGHCVHTIQSELSELKGVIHVEASLETKTVTIDYKPPATEERIKALLSDINYPVDE
jgi:copper chaperone